MKDASWNILAQNDVSHTLDADWFLYNKQRLSEMLHNKTSSKFNCLKNIITNKCICNLIFYNVSVKTFNAPLFAEVAIRCYGT